MPIPLLLVYVLTCWMPRKALLSVVVGLQYWLPAPPILPALTQALLQNPCPPLTASARAWNGCAGFQQSGIIVCTLSGPPELRGAALHAFCAEEIEQTGQSFSVLLQQWIPNPLQRSWQLLNWALAGPDLNRYFPSELQQELAGLLQVGNPGETLLSWKYYQTLLGQNFYELAHQLPAAPSQFWPRSLAVGLGISKTEDQHVLIAQSMDFTHAGSIKREPVVLRIQPDNGERFVAIAWPGMLGILAGVNQSGIGVALVSAYTANPANARGMPVTVLARQILTQATTLSEALSLLRTTPIAISQSFILGSGVEKRVVVVEKSYSGMAVREMQQDYILASNFFQSQLFKHDSINQRLSQDAVGKRWRRLQEIVLQEKELFSPTSVVKKILRDCRGEHNTRLGIGHPAAINTLQATHAVVMDLTNPTLWVSQYPHPINEFRPFTPAANSPEIARPLIPADPLFSNDGFNQFLLYQQNRDEAERLLARRQYRACLALLMEIESLNPEDYRLYYLAGQALAALNRRDEARYNLMVALQRKPAFLEEKEDIQKQLNGLANP